MVYTPNRHQQCFFAWWLGRKCLHATTLGFVSSNPAQVCKLNKVIYGLKQAPRSWFQKLSYTLDNIDFSATKSDPSHFTKFANDITIFILICVNDNIITGSSSAAITFAIFSLNNFFALKDLDSLHHFLGIEAIWTFNGGLHLSQSKYIKELLQHANMRKAKPQPTPMMSSLPLTQDGSIAFEDHTLYRSIVGVLQYVTITRL